MSERLVESRRELGCESLILAECGHGFNSNRWEAPEWLEKKYGFPVKSLGCESLILAECGHGFNSNRWEAPEWLEKKYGFPVKSILQVIAEYIKEGRIRLDASRNEKRVTLHDPCNLVRLGGIVEEQRYILKHAVTDFVCGPTLENRQIKSRSD